MAQDRSEYPDASSEQRPRTSGSATSIAERASDAADEAWRTTRETGRRAIERGQRYGSHIMRHPLSSESVSVFVIGAAAGLALAYTLFRAAGSSATDRSRSQEVVGVLNGLIQISRDGERGFEACADGVADEHLKRIFREAADRCRQGAGELEREVASLGGEPARGGTTSGALHRAWVNVKSSVSGMDELAILNECERGEDVAKRAYATALNGPLPAMVREIVDRQYRGVIQNHDRVRTLRERRAQTPSGSFATR